MELENIVANTVYVKAKKSGNDKDKGRGRKWRTILLFPHITQCEQLRSELDLSYSSLIDQQPIANRLFRLYCLADPHICPIIHLVDQLHNLPVSNASERDFLWEKFMTDLKLQADDAQYMVIFLPLKHLIENLPNELSESYLKDDSFQCISKKLEDYLKDEPYANFLNSMYFDRFLQWKFLERQPVTKDTFRMYRILGKGGFGEVCACQMKATGKLYACKKLEKKRIKKHHCEKMAESEKEILQKLNSRFIVSLAYTFETKNALCLVLTIMNGGDLKFHIHNMTHPGTGLGEDRSKFYACEIASGLEHMHTKNILYRDMKPENILIDDQGHVRISDLGLAVEVSSNGTVRGKVGTAGYMAPEVIMNLRYSFSADWFSFGCVVYEMLMGHCPFRQQKERIKKDEIDRRICEDSESYGDHITEAARSFCSQLLHKDADCRLGNGSNGATFVKAHVWFADVQWPRVEAGLIDPPFVPNPLAVYAKDVLDIEQFSTVKGLTLDENDEKFYSRFCSGAVSIPWQNEMLETGCFDELNEFHYPDGRLVENLDRNHIPTERANRLNFFFRLFNRGEDKKSLFTTNFFKGSHSDTKPSDDRLHPSVKGDEKKDHHSIDKMKIHPSSPCDQLSRSLNQPCSNSVKSDQFNIRSPEADRVSF